MFQASHPRLAGFLRRLGPAALPRLPRGLGPRLHLAVLGIGPFATDGLGAGGACSIAGASSGDLAMVIACLAAGLATVKCPGRNDHWPSTMLLVLGIGHTWRD